MKRLLGILAVAGLLFLGAAGPAAATVPMVPSIPQGGHYIELVVTARTADSVTLFIHDETSPVDPAPVTDHAVYLVLEIPAPTVGLGFFFPGPIYAHGTTDAFGNATVTVPLPAPGTALAAYDDPGFSASWQADILYPGVFTHPGGVSNSVQF